MAAKPLASASDRDLAQAAIAGDGHAFAALYDRHERRAFNLAYRITGSREDAADATQEAFLKLLARLPRLADRELDFGSYLLTAVRHASYDVMARAGRANPTDELPESARPVGAAAAPPPEEEPDRKVLLEASQEEIRAANDSLAPRQREALALRELEGLSYDEIAVLMAMNRNSVAQLISRARIALRSALRHTALHTITPASKACEKALGLIAMRDDGQLKRSDDAGWLDAHLATCDRCVLGREAMAEAGASYRIWAPVAAFEVLRRETIAEAGARLGADWSEAASSPRMPDGAATSGGAEVPGDAPARDAQTSVDVSGTPRGHRRSHDTGVRRRGRRDAGWRGRRSRGTRVAAGGPSPDGAAASVRSRARRDGVAASILATLILLVVFAVSTADGERPLPVANAAPVAVAEPAPTASKAVAKRPAKARKARRAARRTTVVAAPVAGDAERAVRTSTPARPRRASTPARRSYGRASVPPPPPARPKKPSGGTGTSTPPPPPPPPPPADPPDVVTPPTTSAAASAPTTAASAGAGRGKRKLRGDAAASAAALGAQAHQAPAGVGRVGRARSLSHCCAAARVERARAGLLRNGCG